MEKITSFRKERICVNLYKDRDGDMAATLQKIHSCGDDKRKPTPYLQPKFEDVRLLMVALGQFMDADYGCQRFDTRWFL